MEYAIHIDHLDRVVTCTVSGEPEVPASAAATRETRRKAYDLGYNLIYDVCGVILVAGLADAYNFTRDYENVYEDLRHRSSRAAILYKVDSDFWKFMETTARNTGLDIMACTDREVALKWLSAKKTKRSGGK